MDYFASFVIYLVSFQLVVAFPENLVAINTYEGVPTDVFTGGTIDHPEQRLHVQMLKLLEIGNTKRIAIAGREKLYLLDPGQIQDSLADKDANFSEVFSWESKQEARELCRMKGQPQELCYNYLSVLEMANNDQMLICGTNAFAPSCRKYLISVTNDKISLEFDGDEMSGRQRSPYGPSMPTTSLFSGGSLYSATYQSFFGGLSVVSRTMGQAPALRTSTNNVMNEPDFVKMVEDDGRILIFFNEIDMLSTGEKRTIPQVAQVCKNDVGGNRILQGLFTTFIKSRLNCSHNGFYLNQVSDLTKPIQINDELVIFATFSTPKNSLAGSAVCSFTLPSVRTAMLGPFLTNSKKTSSIANVPPPASRHPGLCPTEKLSDDELLYVKSHPQMEKQVAGSMLLTNQGNRWTAIYVSTDSNNVVEMIIGTENGHLVRALPPAQDWPHGIIISDTDVFDKERCSSAQMEKADRRIQKIIVEKNKIFVAFKHCVVTVPVKRCSNHRCQSACNGAADPYCGWNSTSCVPLVNPRKILKENLKTKPCSLETDSRKPSVLEPNSENGERQQNIKLGNKSLTIGTKPPVIAPIESEQCAETASYETLVIVAIIASLITFLITAFIALMCCCCRKRKRSSDEETLKDKQTAEVHHLVNDGEKRDSILRKLQQRCHDCKEFITKATTPISSPEIKSKDARRSRRSENVYTEPPSSKQKQAERGRNIRASNSRFDSASTTSSRKDSTSRSFNNPASKPLLSSPIDTSQTETDTTLPRSIANAATLRLSPNRASDASSPTLSSETSFVARDGFKGMPEAGATSSNSAKLRRSEHAAKQTNEIMRESGSAIRDFETTFKHMQDLGLQQPQDTLQDDALRQRIESDDSGNGESPRNSYQTEQGTAESTKNSRTQQRPMSLNVQKNQPSRRARLLSEGSHPYSDQSPFVVMVPRSNRERHQSGPNSMNSQPTTPVNGPQILSVCQANRFFPEELAAYGHSARNDNISEHQQFYNQQNHHEKMIALQALQNAPPAMYPAQQQQPYMQRPVKLQRQMSEPQGRANVGRSYSTSVKCPPNYYPSLQEKVSHPQIPLFHPQEHQSRPELSGPKNHYPSLPHRNSQSPYGDNNSYVIGPGFERPATLHKREKLPSLMRQTSTPSSTRACVFVPPPTVPRSGAV